MRKISKKRAKLERNRYSIIQTDLEKCYVCPNPSSDWHEIFEGSNRTLSIKYGLCVRLCRKCHSELQYKDLALKLIAKQRFNEEYDEDFIKLFHPKEKELWD